MVSKTQLQELAGRFSSLFMIAYKSQDISAMHVSLTGLSHSLYCLHAMNEARALAQVFIDYAFYENFPETETYALKWLVQHYLELGNEHDESLLLSWYQSLDNEWVLRRQLKKRFPDKKSSEISALILQELNKR